MDDLSWEIARLGRQRRPGTIGVNGISARLQTCRRIGVGVVDGVQHRLDFLKSDRGYENADIGQCRHALSESKFCGQRRAETAPAIKIAGNIAGNNVLCDQSA